MAERARVALAQIAPAPLARYPCKRLQSLHMGALTTSSTNGAPDIAEQLRATAEAMTVAICNLSAAAEQSGAALEGCGAYEFRAVVYRAVSDLIYSPAWETLLDVIENYQAAEIDEAALRIAAITKRQPEALAALIRVWLRSERDTTATFTDCMAALMLESVAARVTLEPARYRFPFDETGLEPAE